MKRLYFFLSIVFFTQLIHTKEKLKKTINKSTKIENSRFKKTLKELTSIKKISRAIANGNLDPSFGRNGLVESDLAGKNLFNSSSRDVPNAMAIQSDGKIVLGGFSTALKNIINFALARYNTDGTLDTSFGNKGLIVTDVRDLIGANKVTYSFIQSIVIQPDGKILAAGSTEKPDTLAFIVRYNSDGSIDQTFGTGGFVITDLGAILGHPNTTSAFDSVILQPDGKILAGGSFGDNIVIARYNMDGTLDTTFGLNNSGLAYKPNILLNTNIILQSDGKILAGSGTGSTMQIVRFNANGQLDSTFGTNGTLSIPFGPQFFEAFATSLAVQPTKIIVGGQTVDNNGRVYYTLIKLNLDGSFDTSFGTNGIVNKIVGPAQVNVERIDIQTDGKIVTGGGNDQIVFAITRTNPDGTFDTTFANDGVLTFSFGQFEFDELTDIKVLPNNQIISCGLTSELDINLNFALAKLNEDGTFNQSFGSLSAGKTVTDYKKTLGIKSGASNSTTSIGLQSDGSIIIGGFSDATDPNYNFSIFKYNTNGSVSNNFAIESIDFAQAMGVNTLRRGFGSYDILNSIAIQSDDKIIGAGLTDFIEEKFSFALTRLGKNGDLDFGFGNLGVVITNFGKKLGTKLTDDIIFSVALQNDKKIVAGGNSSKNNGFTASFALARYKPNGSLDNSFGTLGLSLINVGRLFGLGESFDLINSVVIQDDGKILVGGSTTAKNPFGDFALARYNTNGTLDVTFGNKGIVITNFNPNKTNASQINQIALQDDGKIIAGGVSSVQINSFNPDNPRFNYALVRYNTDGSIDKTFGNNGFVITQLSPGGNRPDSNDYLSAVVIAKDGTIIAGGSSNAIDPNFDFALVVYKQDGSIDTAVGNNGKIFTNFSGLIKAISGSTDAIRAMALQPDGKVLASGNTNNGNPNFNFATARYIFKPTPPQPQFTNNDFILALRQKYQNNCR